LQIDPPTFFERVAFSVLARGHLERIFVKELMKIAEPVGNGRQPQVVAVGLHASSLS